MALTDDQVVDMAKEKEEDLLTIMKDVRDTMRLLLYLVHQSVAEDDNVDDGDDYDDDEAVSHKVFNDRMKRWVFDRNWKAN